MFSKFQSLIYFTFSTSTDNTDFSTFIVARVSTGSYNTGTSVPNSSCTSPNNQRQILIVSIGWMNILLFLLIGIHSLLYFYEKRQSFRNRLSFKIKSKHQDDQSRVNLVSISNDTPVETIYFIENPENGHHSEENSDFK